MSANTLPAFTFEGSNVRVFMINNEPWFAATDVARCIGIKDPKDAVKNLRSCERSGFKPERGGSLTIISESGMYTMVLRSDAAIKEGTAAFRFRVWVTDEVLPAIRKTGKYACPIATLTPAQQLQLREAVAKRAKAVSAHYQTIYRALYARFQVPRYTEILAKDFDDAIEFVRTVDIRVSESRQPTDPEELPGKSTERPLYVSSLVMERLQTFVYYYRYLFREEIDRLINIMRLMGSPHAEMLWDSLHDIHLGLLEDSLAKQGYAVKDLDSYRYWSKRAKACQLA